MEHKKFRNTVEFQVSGNYALFSDPITRVGGEKISYQIPTYEAVKGILHSVFWKPTIKWVIDEMRIMKPIQTETKAVKTLLYRGGNDLSYYTYLKDVSYQVRAHFVRNENRPEFDQDWNENKYHNMARRMIERGGRRDIFLGTRECQGYVEPCIYGEGEGYYDEMPGELAFGFMYHGLTYADEAERTEDKGKLTVRFWQPVMKEGYVIFRTPEECTKKRHLHNMEIKKFPDKKSSGLKEFAGEEGA